MLFPTTFTIIASLLIRLCSSTPIFNTLPGSLITGPVGRNIRNLPCISRKSSEKGVCMFAIDCQKANGTHLGTCIDRFYFGSCCLIEPIHDVSNSIDTAIIPSRQPPSRISSTTTGHISRVTEKPSSHIYSPSTSNTHSPSTSNSYSPSPSNYSPSTSNTYSPSTSNTYSSSTSNAYSPSTSNTYPPSASLKTSPPSKPTTQPILLGSAITKPTHYYFSDKLTTQKLTTPLPTTAPTPLASSIYISSTNKITLQPNTSTEISYKLTTFQTVDENTVTNEPLTTQQIKSNYTRTRPTHKPKPTTSYSRITTASTTRLPITLTTLKQKPLTRRTTTTAKPTTTFLKPLKITKPTKTSTILTKKPTTLLTKITKKPTLITSTNRYVTERPTLSSSTQKIASSTNKIVHPTTLGYYVTSPALTTLDRISTLLGLFNYTSSTLRPFTATTSPTTKKPTLSTTLETGSGNIGTNEIEQPKPLSPPPTTEEISNSSLVTWAIVEDDKATSKTDLTEDWMPITSTTPDSWVLLPSVASAINPNISNVIINNTTKQNETQSEKPLDVSSSSTSTAPFDYSLENNLTFSSSSSFISTGTSPTISSTITNLIETSSMAPLGVNMSDYTDVCGRRLYPEARIVGGERATFGKWPWQISLRQWRTSTYLHKCGAALLNENWAITAAHCVDNVPPSDLLLRLGEHDLSTDNEPYIHQERRVQIVASHPQFDPRTFEYDLALLRFYEPVQFQPNIIPVCVPKNDENFVGKTAHVTGWGRLYEDGPLPSVLQEVSVPVINNTVCESMYRSAGYIEHIPHIFICAGWRRGGFDSCEGDSGGPMVIQRPDKRFLLAGVISWGIGCAEPNQPGVYTRISEFRDWINQILQF